MPRRSHEIHILQNGTGSGDRPAGSEARSLRESRSKVCVRSTSHNAHLAITP